MAGFPSRHAPQSRKARRLAQADAKALIRAADVLERREREWEATAKASGLDLSLVPGDRDLIGVLHTRAALITHPGRPSTTYRNRVLAAFSADLLKTTGKPMEADIAAALGLAVKAVNAVRLRANRRESPERRLAEIIRRATGDTPSE